MNARRTLAATVAAFAMGCGPTINVTTSSGEGGESSDAPDSSSSGLAIGSTGIGGSETGLVDTATTTGASSGGSSDPSSGGGSSSTGEPLSECFMVDADNGPTCICDGIISDPEDCGCFVVPESGECWCGDCPNGGDCQEWPGMTCTTSDPNCDVDPTTAECTCPVVFVPPACWCGEIAVEC